MIIQITVTSIIIISRVIKKSPNEGNNGMEQSSATQRSVVADGNGGMRVSRCWCRLAAMVTLLVMAVLVVIVMVASAAVRAAVQLRQQQQAWYYATAGVAVATASGAATAAPPLVISAPCKSHDHQPPRPSPTAIR